MEDLDIDSIGEMMGADASTINQIKTMMQNPEMRNKVNNMMKNKINPTSKTKKIQPNVKCPCDSGKKYKKCCYGSN